MKEMKIVLHHHHSPSRTARMKDRATSGRNETWEDNWAAAVKLSTCPSSNPAIPGPGCMYLTEHVQLSTKWHVWKCSSWRVHSNEKLDTARGPKDRCVDTPLQSTRRDRGAAICTESLQRRAGIRMALTDYTVKPKTRPKICESPYTNLITGKWLSGQGAVVCGGV